MAEISVENRTAYWLEIEVRPGERGYRSVAFTTGGSAHAAISSLLLAIAKAGGKGPAADGLAATPDVLAAARRRQGPEDDPLKSWRILDGLLATIITSGADAPFEER